MKYTVLLIKLAAIAVHAEEYLSADSSEDDRQALLWSLRDPDVRAFLDDKKHAVLLPLKRITKQ